MLVVDFVIVLELSDSGNELYLVQKSIISQLLENGGLEQMLILRPPGDKLWF